MKMRIRAEAEVTVDGNLQPMFWFCSWKLKYVVMTARNYITGFILQKPGSINVINNRKM